MYTFFERRTTGNKGKWRAPMWSYIDGVIAENASKVISYYRKFPIYLKPDHIFCKLVDSLPLCKDGNIPNHITRIESLTDSLVRHFNFTSGIHKGKIFDDGILLKESTKEIVICINEPFDIFNIEKYWQDVTPITFLYHEVCDLTMPMLHGKGSRYNGEIDDLGYNVIELNIPLLAAQYECWRKWNNTLGAGSQHTVAQFLISYPLVNAIRSFTDVAVFNRLKAFSKDIIMEPRNKSHPFPLTDIDGRIDNVLKAFNTVIKDSKSLDFQNIMRSVPIPFAENGWELMHLPVIPTTRQIEWGINLSRLAVINWLLNVGNKSQNTSNLNWFKRRIRDLRSDNIYNFLPPMEQRNIQTYLSKVNAKLTSR